MDTLKKTLFVIVEVMQHTAIDIMVRHLARDLIFT